MAGKVYIFEERQFIGTNKQMLSLRIFLALFCFTAYNFTDVPELNGDLLFILGVAILVISVILLFVTHLHTTIDHEQILLKGSLDRRKVAIPLKSILKAEKIVYSSYLINSPVYNLHRDGEIKFYAGGKDAVKVETADNITYIIGTQKPEELVRVITDRIGKPL